MGGKVYLLGAVVLTLYATGASCKFLTFKDRATCCVNGPLHIRRVSYGMKRGGLEDSYD